MPERAGVIDNLLARADNLLTVASPNSTFESLEGYHGSYIEFHRRFRKTIVHQFDAEGYLLSRTVERQTPVATLMLRRIDHALKQRTDGKIGLGGLFLIITASLIPPLIPSCFELIADPDNSQTSSYSSYPKVQTPAGLAKDIYGELHLLSR